MKSKRKIEAWNENVETCSGCGIQWKKIGKQCPVCYEPAERHEVKQPKPTNKKI